MKLSPTGDLRFRLLFKHNRFFATARAGPRPALSVFAPTLEVPDAGSGVIAFVGLGANLGNRREALETALRELHRPPLISVERVSSVYETAPVGVTDQPDFLNAAARVRTTLGPSELLDLLLDVENKLGRVRTVRWGPRVIDLDLLLYGDAAVALPGLDVPHPRLRLRLFVLAPLAEIAPDLALPPDGKTAAEVFLELSKNSGTFPSAESSNTEAV